MRFTLMLFALLVMAIGPAQAAENRITVTEIHNFIQNASHAINNPNRHVARNFLNRSTADNAVFVNRTAVNNTGTYWHQAWYGNPAYGAYYRYPLNPYYSPTSVDQLGKWDNINLLENKKRMIPGYQAALDVTGTNIHPYGGHAVVDLDMKEYSLSYSPYQPNQAGRTMHANSKCKMYLSKLDDNNIVMTRMDCNTNTNLPF